MIYIIVHLGNIARCGSVSKAIAEGYFEEWKNGENYLDNYDLAIVSGMLNIQSHAKSILNILIHH